MGISLSITAIVFRRYRYRLMAIFSESITNNLEYLHIDNALRYILLLNIHIRYRNTSLHWPSIWQKRILQCMLRSLNKLAVDSTASQSLTVSMTKHTTSVYFCQCFCQGRKYSFLNNAFVTESDATLQAPSFVPNIIRFVGAAQY